MPPAQPFLNRTAPVKSAPFSRIQNTLADLARRAMHLGLQAHARAIASNLAPAAVRAFLRIAGTLQRITILDICLQSPPPPPRITPNHPHHPKPAAPPNPAHHPPPAAPAPRRTRPRRTRKAPDQAKIAIRAMQRRLATTSLTEIVIILGRDLGILPDFDDWVPTGPPPPTTTLPSNIHRPYTCSPRCLPLAALFPFRLSG